MRPLATAGGGLPPAGWKASGTPRPGDRGSRGASPPAGKLYFGVFRGDDSLTGMEDDPPLEGVRSFEEAVGTRVTWVYFSKASNGIL